MILVERHVIKNTHPLFEECERISFLSKNLYNTSNYIIRQNFIKDDVSEYLDYYKINKLMISNKNVDYQALPRKVSNGVLRLVDKNWKSFFQSIKDWKMHPNKYQGRPSLPKYKHKKLGRFVVPYERDTISKTELKKNGNIKLSQSTIKIPSKVTYEQLQAVRIVPNYLGFYVIEVLYNKEIENRNLNKEHVMAIDLGVNNLATIITTQGKRFIINGRPLKSINQYWNKEKSFLQSKLKKNQYKSHRINKLSNKRNNKINDYLHKASRYIINFCLTNDIGKIVIGCNKNWKRSINIGTKNNQNFVQIPFETFISQLKYKAELFNIDITIREESYTSKCSFYDDESIEKHDNYLGKRIKRGLFKTKDRILLNADVNGALNILRKEVTNFNIKYYIENVREGIAVCPQRINFS